VIQSVLPLHECADSATVELLHSVADSTAAKFATEPRWYVANSTATESAAEPLQSVADSAAVSATLTEISCS
jgi:hypothetical protein